MIFILSLSIGLNVFLFIRMMKVNKILNGIKDLNEFVKQETEKTRILAEKLQAKTNISEIISEVETYVATKV